MLKSIVACSICNYKYSIYCVTNMYKIIQNNFSICLKMWTGYHITSILYWYFHMQFHLVKSLDKFNTVYQLCPYYDCYCKHYFRIIWNLFLWIVQDKNVYQDWRVQSHILFLNLYILDHVIMLIQIIFHSSLVFLYEKIYISKFNKGFILNIVFCIY